MCSRANILVAIGVLLGIGGALLGFHAQGATDDLMRSTAGIAAVLGYAMLYYGYWSR